MARSTDAKCKKCRREGMKLFLKGERCLTEKCGVERRAYPPGQHGRGRIKQSEYLLQLREKQKAKRYYGVLEKQFANYYDKASRKSGITGENLIQMLERRLDNVVYRLHLAPSRKSARQLVLHGHIAINGRRASIHSQLVRESDEISVKERSTKLTAIKESLKEYSRSGLVPWLEMDPDRMVGKVRAIPRRSEITDLADIKEQLIVELYSK